MIPAIRKNNLRRSGPWPSDSLIGVYLRASAVSLLLCLLFLGCAEKDAGPVWEVDKLYKKGPVELHLRVSKERITIAERLTLELEALAEEGYEVELPRFGEKLEEFGIVDYESPPKELTEDGRVKTLRVYTLEPFLSGDYKIPSMTVLFRETGGTDGEHELQTEEVAVQVNSLLPKDVEELEIRDIAGPDEIPSKWLLWTGLGAGVLLLVVLAAGLFWWLRRRRIRQEEERRRMAHELAYARLEKLIAEELLEKGMVKRFYNELSWILRHYIEDRFGLKAPERTTEEFLRELQGNGTLETSWQRILARFLGHCDLVKFAEHVPSKEEIQETFDTTKAFIEATREVGSLDDEWGREHGAAHGREGAA